MRKDAEINADADTKKRELVEVQNAADQIVYAAEKALREHGDKVSEDIKKNVQQKIDALKSARAGTDTNAIKSASDALSTAMSAIGEAMSKQQPPPSAEGGSTSGGQEPPKDGQTPPEEPPKS